MTNDNNTQIFYFLSAAIASSILGGVFLPSFGNILEPYILLWLGLLLFFNLIHLNTSELFFTFKRTRVLLLLSLFKLIVIPIIIYIVGNYIEFPKPSKEILLSMFLLSGISTGLGSPFVTNFVSGQLPIVVGLIITTSLSVPFILPALVYILFNSQFSIPLENMIVLLSIALFIPLIASNLIRKYFPIAITKIAKRNLLFSIIFIFLMNYAVFAKYSSFFFHNLNFVLDNILIAFVLFTFYGFVGYFFAKVIGLDKKERISIFIAMSYVNNMLVVVLAQQFFNTQVAALSAFYNIPYYLGILLLHKAISSKISITK
ncbi:MAG: bile acid:sodium symporter family protein [Candidatus Nitrosocosmicus sp.]